MSTNTKERLTTNRLNSLSITFLKYFKLYFLYSFIVKILILYISFTLPFICNLYFCYTLYFIP